MASSGNFGSNNTLIRMSIDGTDVPTNGNRTLTSTSGSWGTPLNMAAKTGKWYIEYYVNSGSSGRNVMVVPTNSLKYQQANYNFAVTGDYVIQLNSNGSVYNNNDSTATQSGFTVLQTGDIMAMALNLDASPKTLQFYRNGTSVGTAENINASATGHFTFMHMGHNGSTITVNAGQDSSFAGAKSTGTANAADDNGFGNFYHTPPSGFLAMCAGNLPIDENIDPAQTDSNFPQKNFNALAYTGTGSSQALTGLGFKPDLIWIKQRNGSGHNVLTDSTRGVTKQLEITDTEGGTQPAESTNADGVTAFGTDGFTVGGDAEYSGNTNTYVAWCWRAGEGTTSTNTDGTHACTLQANQAAGFSIMTLANYTSGTGVTIGHGLGKKPTFYIHKSSSSTGNWHVYHSVTGATKSLFLNTYSGGSAAAGYWNNTEPTTSVLSLGNTFAGTSDGVVYAWTDVEGYSKFGSYEGNNTDDNGPFVYTGFRPRLLVIKGVDESYGWYVFDSARNPNNLVDDMVSWFPGGAESSEPTGARKVDFYGNGFKVMADAASINGSNDTYAYMCWGDVPYKYNNGF